ncbi:MAG: hypothetical protein SFZ23_00295 [Planctomycetota bacterium]|nr:hypothetical protein [Planctomycetota bacterium]
MRLSSKLSAVATLALAAAAFAAPRDTVTFNGVDSNGPLNNAANGLRDFAATGGYSAFRISFAGDVVPVNTGTFRTELRILVTPPASFGAPFTIAPFATGTTWTGTLSFTLDRNIDPGVDPAGNWNFRFYETFDDGGTASVDAQWTTFSATWDDAPPPPPPPPSGAIDLGDVGLGTVINRSDALAAGQVIWYRINLTQDVGAGAPNTYLDLDTLGTALVTTVPGPSADTEIGIYRAPSGTRVANDDDSGPGLTSQLSFGAGRRLANFAQTGADTAPNEGANFSGQAGATLGAGEYYIAVSGFSTTHLDAAYGVTSTSTLTGTVQTNIRFGAERCGPADFNGDGQSDFFDYLDFVVAFDTGC